MKMKAGVALRAPFTIQLLEPGAKEAQPFKLGSEPGSSTTGSCVYSDAAEAIFRWKSAATLQRI
ncbi:MAG: RRXRR domain-containing protein [Deltaproteobacteria bacterium]|nr:RRXRR domain-containing protein [Deltaproteobacteria bacterium]